jgi:hypothetical protein
MQQPRSESKQKMPKTGSQSRSATCCSRLSCAELCSSHPLPLRLLLAPCSEQQPPMAPLLHAAPRQFAARHLWTSTSHGTLVSTPAPSPSSSSRPNAPPLSTRHPCSREPSLTSPSAAGSLPAVAVHEVEEAPLAYDMWAQIEFSSDQYYRFLLFLQKFIS